MTLAEQMINEDVTKSFRTGSLERELQMVQLSATRCSCIAILWVSLVSFAAITLCVTSQRVFIGLRAGRSGFWGPPSLLSNGYRGLFPWW